MKYFYISLFFLLYSFSAFAQPAFIIKGDQKFYIKVNPKTFQVTFKGEDGSVYQGMPDLNTIDYQKVFDQSVLKPGKTAVASQPGISAAPLAKTAVADTSFTLLGAGSGILRLGKLSGQKIKVKPGTYDYINITSANHVKLDLSGVTLAGGKLDIDDGLNDVEIWGLKIRDQKSRGIEITGFSNDVYLHDMEFDHVGDMVINYRYFGFYNGTPASASKNFRLVRLRGKNISRLFNVDGGFKPEGIMNLMLNFKMSNCTVMNSPDLGSMVWIAAGQDYEIFQNTVNEVNMDFPDPNAPHGYHNGLWHIVGNGAFHDNKVTNHQGNAIRAWAVSFGQDMKTIRIYNNKVYNSYKYGAFEVQATPEIQEYLKKYPKRISPAKAKVYNNTAGRLNTAKDWEGQMLDLYNTLGPVEYYNNLGFEMNRQDKATTDMINYNGAGTSMKMSGNIYRSLATQAVTDKVTFKSRFKGVGAQ